MLDRLRASIHAAKMAWRSAVFAGRPMTDSTLADWFGVGTSTKSGVDVTASSAIQFSFVWDCINVLAQDIAKVPLILYRRDRDADNSRSHAKDHPLYQLLKYRPNSKQTSYQFRLLAQATILLRGNFYAWIKYDGRGRPEELIPWSFSHIRTEQDSFALKYWLRIKGGSEVQVPADEIFHIRGLNLDYNGLLGVSPITAMREAIGEGIAAQRYGAAFFKNQARPSATLSHPGELTDQAGKNIRKSWEDLYQGDNAHRIAILEEGVTYTPISITNEDAQFLETRKFNRGEIAAIFRIPPYKIGDLERATFSNIEQQSIEYVYDTLMPHAVNWEQQIWFSLLSDAEKETYKAEFNLDSLLRGDSAARWATHAQSIQWGVRSPNEVRELENMNPREGGDEYLQPSNMVISPYYPSQNAGQGKTNGTAKQSENDRVSRF